MPSFVCDYCQETLKKAKLDSHAQRCRQAAFSCIDCYKTFKGTEYRDHFSCITEVQKYHQKQQPAPVTNAKTMKSDNQKPIIPVTPAASPIKSDSKFTVALKSLLKSNKSDSLNFKIVKKQLKKSLGKKAKKTLQEKILFSINKDTNELVIKLDQ